jgi:radical SAM protein with 4Fe4S-binding SPASM domain
VETVVLDIRADLPSTRLGECWSSLPRLFGRYPEARRVFSVHRREILLHWDRCGLRSATCFHIAGSESVRSSLSRAHQLPLGARADWVHDDDYLVFAVREGLVGRLVCILPDTASLERWKREIPSRFGPYASRVEAILAAEIAAKMPTPQTIYCALLAPTIGCKQLHEILDSSGADPELAERAIEAHRDACCGQAPEDAFVFPYNAPSDVAGSGAWLYHGSPVRDLERLVPAPGRPVFVSPVAAFASCYGLDLRNENGWVQGTDALSDDEPFTYLLVPPGRERELEQPCALYRIPEGAASFAGQGSVSGYEFACGQEIPVADSVTFPSIAQALATNGVRVFRRGTDAIPDKEILNVLERERTVAESFFEISAEDIRSLPFFGTLLYAYFVGCRGHAPSEFSPRHRVAWQRLLRRLVFPTLGPYALQPATGYHGLLHSYRVARDASVLALDHDSNPLLAMIAGVLHDAARADDEDEQEHALAGSVLAQEVLSKKLTAWVTPEGARRVVAAVRGHVDEATPTDTIARCLNDADRLRLAWERGYDARYFATSAGARLAIHGADFASNWTASRLHAGPTELKFEVTAACDLDCGFCHRRGVAEPSGTVKFEAFVGGLRAATGAGIRSVRLTGGEPFLHKELRRLAEAAQEVDLEVVVNTNATAVPTARMLALADVIDCFKVSLPGFDEESTRLATGSSHAWQQKMESIGELMAHGCRVEVLTVMTSVNIRHFDRFLDLFEPLERLRWLPLRPEPTPHDQRPITRSALGELTEKIDVARSLGPRWADLQLNLAVPFCAVDRPELASRVLRGRLGCGPADSLTVTAQGDLISCYSRRTPIDQTPNLAEIWRRTLEREFDQLPTICQRCVFGWRCLGGCRCEWALEDTPDGRFDYLAIPVRASAWSS